MSVKNILIKSWLMISCLSGSLVAQAYEPADTLESDVRRYAESHVLDVSANGRYVLMSNFDPAWSELLGTDPNQPAQGKWCEIYRRDLQTGDLQVAFTGNNSYTYCGNAKISSKSTGVVKNYAVNSHPGFVNTINEDRISIITNLNKVIKNTKKVSFFGIYGGKNGPTKAEYMRDSFHQILFCLFLCFR